MVLSQLSTNNQNTNNSSNNLDAGANKNNLLADNLNNFIAQNYQISPQIKHILQDVGLSERTYKTCYSNSFQQLVHQENLDQLQQLGTRQQLGWMTRDNTHLNVSLDGRVTHK